MADLRTSLVELGRQAGLHRIGFASAEPFIDVRRSIDDRRRTGRSARLTFTYKDPSRSTDVGRSFPWAAGLVVAIRGYVPEVGRSSSAPGRARIARFAVEDPYHPLRAGLQEMADELRSRGHRAEVLVDDDRLVDRAAAVRAGVGWWGKSTMVLSPGLGPWFVIGSVVTDAPLEADEPMTRGCGTCTACLPACPTGALEAPGVLDARKCLAAIAQTDGVIPRRWRAAMGDRLYGCDDCLDACPPGLRIAATEPDAAASVSLEWVLTAADRTLVDRFSHFYLPDRSPRVVRRNALVALGNEANRDYADLAASHTGHPDWVLRAHAVWALGRIGEPMARPVLTHRLERERHPHVKAELEAELI